MAEGKKHNNISSKPVDVDAVAIKTGDRQINVSVAEPLATETIQADSYNNNNSNNTNAAATGAAPKAKKTSISKSNNQIGQDDLKRINTNKGLRTLLQSKEIKLKKVFTDLEYEEELEKRAKKKINERAPGKRVPGNRKGSRRKRSVG